MTCTRRVLVTRRRSSNLCLAITVAWLGLSGIMRFRDALSIKRWSRSHSENGRAIAKQVEMRMLKGRHHAPVPVQTHVRTFAADNAETCNGRWFEMQQVAAYLA